MIGIDATRTVHRTNSITFNPNFISPGPTNTTAVDSESTTTTPSMLTPAPHDSAPSPDTDDLPHRRFLTDKHGTYVHVGDSIDVFWPHAHGYGNSATYTGTVATIDSFDTSESPTGT